MANTLSKTGIVDGQVAIAGHVTQSVDAFTGEVAYDITISGSLTVTGSTDLIGNLAIPGFPDVSASLAASGVGNGFPYTGSAAILGTLSLDGPEGHITASGNISASGNIFGDSLYAQGGAVWTANTQSLRNVSNGLSVGSAPQFQSVTLGRAGKDMNLVGVLASDLTASAAAAISGANAINGNILIAGTRVETPRVSAGSATQLLIGDAQGIQIDGNVTMSSAVAQIISGASEVNAITGSFSHLVGNSPITVGDSIIFQSGTSTVLTHTTSFTSSRDNAGYYHIVDGLSSCSVQDIGSMNIGAEFEFFQTASNGNFLFHTASGVTLISKNDSHRLAGLGSSAVLKKVATNTFHLMGDLT